MAASDTLLRLLVILLGFSHLISLNAIPATRIGSLMHGPSVHDQVTEKTNQMAAKESFWDEQATINGRMDVELHDYPGSGANNRHTPKPQNAKCADC
ncbi:uncharacterized protein LOC125422412 isoform X1 [Ziziphus jujuba]|uniref:Uncharacterized protein LOC125422412 isoform X1 n=1 Tax=Ziziphus jujuba TaxID=326968 RepID=A0ABM3IJS6_ZIZJJ|nr:uncharacterized protein LOC125422412 isoform X1 [Ziziphus jujuba]